MTASQDILIRPREERSLFDVIRMSSLASEDRAITLENIEEFPTGLVRTSYKLSPAGREVNSIDLVLVLTRILTECHLLLDLNQLNLSQFVTSENDLSVLSQFNGSHSVTKRG